MRFLQNHPPEEPLEYKQDETLIGFKSSNDLHDNLQSYKDITHFEITPKKKNR